jgi:GNAT superfamily N-acetyltransferase
VLERIRDVVDAEWEVRLGVDRTLLHSGGVHVVAADLGRNDAMSFLLAGTCFVAVAEDQIDAAGRLVSGLRPREAFSAETLRALVGSDCQVDGPSVHTYADERSFRGEADPSAAPIGGGDVELIEFLKANALGEWAESGFPRDPVTADPERTQFWVSRDNGRVVAAGNLTEWRNQPADVGVLVGPTDRGRGLARRLVGTMVHIALPTVGVVRYRALASNAASLAVARRLGFVEYGQNYRARRAR